MTVTLTESPALPERIAGLATLARNLSWSWNHEARALYRSIDPTLWGLTRHNPFALLRRGGAAKHNPAPAPPRVPRPDHTPVVPGGPGACRCPCSTPAWSRRTPPTASYRTGCTAARTT